MSTESVVHIVSQTLMAAFWISAPLLIIGFVVGIIINLIQIATSMQDSAISTIPRLAAFLVGSLALMPWMLKRMVAFALMIFGDLSRYAQ